MALLHNVQVIEPPFPKVCEDQNEALRMECGRLINAAVVSRRFLNRLLTDPIQTIEDGFCGEKFAFTREEKQQIKHIHATDLAEFSNLLIQAVEFTSHISVPAEMAYARLEVHKGLSA